MQQFDIIFDDTELIQVAKDAVIHQVAHLRGLHLTIEVVDAARADRRGCDTKEVLTPLVDLEVQDYIVAQKDLVDHENVDTAFFQVTQKVLFIQNIKTDINPADSYGFKATVKGVLDDIKRHLFFFSVDCLLHRRPDHFFQDSHNNETLQFFVYSGSYNLHDKGASFIEIHLWVNRLEMQIRKR